MRFAHLSDLHLNRHSVSGEWLASVVRHMVSDVRRISEFLDFVVVSGDLTEQADQDSFQQFQEIFTIPGLPIYMVPGNHDGPAEYYHALEQSETLSTWNLADQVVNLSEIRLLGIDTSIAGETTGRINPETFPVIREAAEERGAAPLVVVMHHSPVSPGLRDFDDISRLEGATELLDCLRGAEIPPVILSGHVHRPYQIQSNGVTCFIAGSPTAYTSDFPFGNSPVRPRGIQDFYFVHEMTRQGQHRVTPQHVYFPPSLINGPQA